MPSFQVSKNKTHGKPYEETISLKFGLNSTHKVGHWRKV